MAEQQIENKRKNEQEVCDFMIQIFCHKKHKTPSLKNIENLCSECKELSDYVHLRVSKCPFMETKTFCAMCKVHCYKPQMREKIRTVMRFSGPRMVFYHPILAIKHLVLTIKENSKIRKNKK